MSEQRLVTLHGGPRDGQSDAWEAGQTERRVRQQRFSEFMGSYDVTVGYYVCDPDGGDAYFSERNGRPPMPENRDVPPRPWWRFW